MANRAFSQKQLFVLFLSAFSFLASRSEAAESIELYTPYTKIIVPPGETVEYTIDVKNNSQVTQEAELAVTGLPSGWTATLKAGGYTISRIAVLPGEKKSLNLKIEVPRKVNKGNHSFRVQAGNLDVLPLVITVSEQGSLKTEFFTDQINLQGDSKADFRFSARLKNQTGDDQVYALQALPPAGWNVIFKPNNKQATAVEVAPNATASISIEVKPPLNVEAGTYTIPVEASNRSTSANLELEVVITGSYELDLTTPSGLLSSKITAGGKKDVELSLVNTGSVPLENIVLKAAAPAGWSVTFSPEKITQIATGERSQVYAHIKAADRAIPGDYAVTLTAQAKESTSKAAFRISVKTPLLWGWIGILIVGLTLAAIIYLFRKYGRR